MPLHLCVDSPSVKEIQQVCATLKMQCEIEKKAYPRDYMQGFRVRVLLKENGVPVNCEIRNSVFCLCFCFFMVENVLLSKISSQIAALTKRTPAPSSSAIFSSFLTSAPKDVPAPTSSTAATSEKKKKGKK